jgi:lysophospholipase L1-like esterase
VEKRPWTREVGGVPLWLLGLAAILLASLVGTAAALRQQSPDDYVARPQPTLAPPIPLALFIGDSYAAGAGASTASARWTSLAAHELGWEEVNKARGGTGYVTASDRSGCGREYCPPFPEVLADPFDRVPDIVVISGGRNDPSDLDAFRAGVAATLARVRSTWPEAELVVTNPLWDDNPLPPGISARLDVIVDVAAQYDALVLDLGQPLVGRPEFVASDGVQPNDDGHQTIASAFVAAWRTTHPTPSSPMTSLAA